jgi:ParB family chromosome partitioning protein
MANTTRKTTSRAKTIAAASLRIESAALDSLHADSRNARSHDKRNIKTIAASLKRFGQQKPLVVGASNQVIAGNGTLQAAKSLGWKSIEIIRTTLEGAEALAYAIADNRSAELADWDRDILADLLKDEEIGEVGFTAKEIDKLLRDNDPADDDSDMQDEFRILITCDDEAQQTELLERLSGEGVECKALVG